MRNALRNDLSVERALAHRNKLGKRTKRTRQQFALESLESRTLLSYTFSYVGTTATALGTTGTDSLVIAPIGGLLEYSVGGATFNSNWGTVAVPVTVPVPGVTAVNVTLESGDGASLQLGGNSGANVGGPASATLGAAFILTVPVVNTTDTVVIDDSSSTAASTYKLDTGNFVPNFPITGPGINFQEPTGIANGGITLKGSSGATGDIYNVLSAFPSEPVNVVAGASTGNIVNIGNNPLTPLSPLGNILAPVSVTDPTGSATLNLLDAGDATSAPANITGSTVTGLGFGSGGSVAYTGGATTGVTALNIYGGTDGASGVTYNFTSTSTNTTLNDGPNADTVNVGSNPGTPANSTLGGIVSTLTVNDSTGSATLNLLDAGDTTHAAAGLDNLSGNPAAPFEVTNLSAALIEYGAGVTALNIYGGTYTSAGGTAGVTYDINNTQAGTTTTIYGGPNRNFYNLQTSSEAGGLSNLPGQVVVNGGGAGDEISLIDLYNNASDNYTVTGTTVTSTGAFGGLTYGGLGAGLLFLSAENNLGTNGNNIIDINSTANGVTTFVSGEGGVDVYNVNGTGTGSALDIFTGDNTDQASTVNVLADSEPVNISSLASSPAITTVNIGSTGGPGSMANIQGPISVANTFPLTALNFHDENDTTGRTWTLNNSDGLGTGSVAVTGSATTTYVPADLSELTVNGGSGGNTFTVNDTSGFYPTTLNTGTGADVVDVFATGANTLDIHGQAGTDTVTLGALAAVGMHDLNGTISVDNAAGSTALTLDDSQDTTGRTASLTNNGTTGAVTGLSPAVIGYTDTGISSLTLNAGSGDDTVNVNVLNLDPTSTYNLDGGPGINTLNVESGGNEVIGTTTTITYGALVLNYKRFEIVNALTFTVTNTNDAGIGSLRYAMQNADAVPTLKTVKFRILQGTAPFTIQPLSPLPIISQPTIINGYTQHGASPNTMPDGDNAVLLIELNGANAGIGVTGLSINAWGSTVEGLVINRFGGAGIAITGSGASNNAVLGNFIGTNAAGTAALGNGTGVLIDNGASNNTIGGPTDNDRNVISGNGGASQGVGVYLDGTTTQSNSIIGNFIGTKAAGTAGISASSAGVLINNAPDNTIGGTTAADRNIISGNSVVGVYIALAGATGNAVQNNYIGTDVHGLAGIPNGVDGIYINDAPNNTIGGTAAGAGNLISANLSAGIQIYGAGATNNQIFRNRIGLNANGRLTLPNKVTGIFSQISIKANDFGFSTVNQNLGQVLPWQSPSSIGGGTVSGASQAAVAAHRKASRARSVSGHHGPLSKRKTVIVTAVHSYPNAKLALGLSRKSPGLG